MIKKKKTVSTSRQIASVYFLWTEIIAFITPAAFAMVFGEKFINFILSFGEVSRFFIVGLVSFFAAYVAVGYINEKYVVKDSTSVIHIAIYYQIALAILYNIYIVFLIEKIWSINYLIYPLITILVLYFIGTKYLKSSVTNND